MHSILDIVETPPTPPLARKKQTLHEETVRASRQLFDQLLASRNTLYDCHWHGTAGLSPQQAFDAHGAKAASLVQASAETDRYLLALQPGCIPTDRLGVPAEYRLAINENGTVTITEA